MTPSAPAALSLASDQLPLSVARRSQPAVVRSRDHDGAFEVTIAEGVTAHGCGRIGRLNHRATGTFEAASGRRGTRGWCHDHGEDVFTVGIFGGADGPGIPDDLLARFDVAIRDLPDAGSSASTMALSELETRCASWLAGPPLTGSDAPSIPGGLVMVQVRWPVAWVMRVGEYGCYHGHGASMARVISDGTVSDRLISQGILVGDHARAIEYRRDGKWNDTSHTHQTRIDVARIRLTPGDSFLLGCTALTDYVTDHELMFPLNVATPPAMACDKLLSCARGAGSPDDIAAVLVRFW